MSAISGHCRHYGHTRPGKGDLGHATCAAGVDNKSSPHWRPCMPRTSELFEGACQKREEWTPEEVDQALAERSASMERLGRCMAAIPPRLPGRASFGTSGTVECPVCNGTISWSRARLNGHLWAACSTPSCFSVIQ